MDAEKWLEVKRQLFHLCLGSVTAMAVWVLKPVYGNLILIPLFIAIAVLLAVPKLIPQSKASTRLLTHFEREKDVRKFPYRGAIYYGVGIVFPIVLLPVELACVVILILSVGDAMSTLIGKFHGKYRIGHKSAEGTVAFVMFAFTASVLFLEMAGRMDLTEVALKLTVIGALIEIQDWVDDNLAVPLVLSILARVL